MTYRLGIDVGGTNLAAALVDEQYRMYGKCSVPTEPECGFDRVLDSLVSLAGETARRAGIPLSETSAVGVGCPGTPDENGRILFSGNLGWDNAPLGAALSSRLHLPVSVQNDANCAALGETLAGAAKGYSSAVLITFGTGIGGGIVINGALYPGFNGAAGELGHMQLFCGGVPCTCGRLGCWERYASMTALVERARAAASAHPESVLFSLLSSDTLNGKTVFDAAKSGDPVAESVVSEFLRLVAAGIVNVVNLLMPAIVLIGGALANEGGRVLPVVRETIRREAFCRNNAVPEVRCAALGNDAGIIGAAFG